MLAQYLDELEKQGILLGRSETEIAALLAGAEPKRLKHREVVYRAGDHASNFALVVQGAFKLAKDTPSGDEFIVHFATPGDPVGALVMSNSKGTYPVTVVAMGASIVFSIPKSSDIRAQVGPSASVLSLPLVLMVEGCRSYRRL